MFRCNLPPAFDIIAKVFYVSLLLHGTDTEEEFARKLTLEKTTPPPPPRLLPLLAGIEFVTFTSLSQRSVSN